MGVVRVRLSNILKQYCLSFYSLARVSARVSLAMCACGNKDIARHPRSIYIDAGVKTFRRRGGEEKRRRRKNTKRVRVRVETTILYIISPATATGAADRSSRWEKKERERERDGEKEKNRIVKRQKKRSGKKKEIMLTKLKGQKRDEVVCLRVCLIQLVRNYLRQRVCVRMYARGIRTFRDQVIPWRRFERCPRDQYCRIRRVTISLSLFLVIVLVVQKKEITTWAPHSTNYINQVNIAYISYMY